MLGPNGFHRHFTGKASEQKLEASLFQYDKAGRQIVLLMRNDSDAERRFKLTPDSYGKDGHTVSVAAHGQQLVPWSVAESSNWYDLSVRIEGLPGYRRRFAGRMETGLDSVSDPAA